MSTTQSGVQPAPAPPEMPHQREIRVYSHSSLFYWWPVWFVGFLMALLTFADGHVMAVVPEGTVAERGRVVPGHGGDEVDVLVVPGKKHLPPHDLSEPPVQPHIHMAASKNLGVLFATVLLVIIVISNVPMHGLWSVIVVLGVVLFVVIFALAGWLEPLLDKLSYLDVHINAGGYLFISTVLFIIWAVTVLVFDHRKYVAVTPGQVRVCQAIGTGEDVYDTAGLTFAKRQDDLFRHWIVGLGSGDLIIHRPNTKDIDMPNVLFIGSKVKEMEQLIREKQVV